MNLLYVIDSLAPGGAETSLVSMVPGLTDRGINVHVLPLGKRLDLLPQLQNEGAIVHTRTSAAGRFGNVAAVVRTARGLRPSLIHTTLYEADIAGRMAAYLLRIPASTSIVNDAYGPSHYAESSTTKLHLARSLDGLTCLTARRFHALSGSIADSVAGRLPIRRDRIDVIPRGRDPHKFPYRSAAARTKARCELRIPSHAAVVLAVGRLEPQKGLHHLLAALPAVARENKNLVLLIAGKQGRSSRSLRDLATLLRLDVRFLGHRSDVPELLAAADVFCFPSEREGFGGVLVEALAVGCPIVASAIPTSFEVLLGSHQQPVGRLTPVGDSALLANAINGVLSNPTNSRAMAAEGRAHFEQRFTLAAVDDLMVQFFKQAAS